MEVASFIISILALLGSVWSVSTAIKYSNISVIHSLQEIVLNKSKDCNAINKEALIKFQGPKVYEFELLFVPVVSEIIISLQLIENSLERYKQNKQKSFYLLQFWIQLDTSIRGFIKNNNFAGFHEITQRQLQDIRKKFEPLLGEY